MTFEAKEVSIYDELEDVEGTTGVVKGDAAVVQDVFGFYAKDLEETGEEIAFIYRCRQVEAQKATGTGQSISAGDRLYYIVATKKVSKTPGSTLHGSSYYFCGWAKRDATANATTVLMNFDGTRYNEDL
jgi:hypothetical protein